LTNHQIDVTFIIHRLLRYSILNEYGLKLGKTHV
jgi:hypothetical protein